MWQHFSAFLCAFKFSVPLNHRHLVLGNLYDYLELMITFCLENVPSGCLTLGVISYLIGVAI